MTGYSEMYILDAVNIQNSIPTKPLKSCILINFVVLIFCWKSWNIYFSYLLVDLPIPCGQRCLLDGIPERGTRPATPTHAQPLPRKAKGKWNSLYTHVKCNLLFLPPPFQELGLVVL